MSSFYLTNNYYYIVKNMSLKCKLRQPRNVETHNYGQLDSYISFRNKNSFSVKIPIKNLLNHYFVKDYTSFDKNNQTSACCRVGFRSPVTFFLYNSKYIESKVEKSRVRRNEKSEVKSSKTKEGTQGFRFLEKLTRKRMKRNTAEIINEVVRGDLKVSSSKYSVELRFNYRNIFLFFVS